MVSLPRGLSLIVSIVGAPRGPRAETIRGTASVRG